MDQPGRGQNIPKAVGKLDRLWDAHLSTLRVRKRQRGRLDGGIKRKGLS